MAFRGMFDGFLRKNLRRHSLSSVTALAVRSMPTKLSSGGTSFFCDALTFFFVIFQHMYIFCCIFVDFVHLNQGLLTEKSCLRSKIFTIGDICPLRLWLVLLLKMLKRLKLPQVHIFSAINNEGFLLIRFMLLMVVKFGIKGLVQKIGYDIMLGFLKLLTMSVFSLMLPPSKSSIKCRMR